jgi:hypothetical protein
LGFEPGARWQILLSRCTVHRQLRQNQILEINHCPQLNKKSDTRSENVPGQLATDDNQRTNKSAMTSDPSRAQKGRDWKPSENESSETPQGEPADEQIGEQTDTQPDRENGETAGASQDRENMKRPETQTPPTKVPPMRSMKKTRRRRKQIRPTTKKKRRTVRRKRVKTTQTRTPKKINRLSEIASSQQVYRSLS